MHKLIIAFLFTLYASYSLAGSNPLGLEFGKSVTNQATGKYSLSNYNYEIDEVAGGKIYFVPGDQVDLYGVENAEIIYDKGDGIEAGKLVSMNLNFKRVSFSYLFNELSKKYKAISKEESFLGKDKAVFQNGNIIITLVSKTFSGYTAKLYYSTEDYMKLIDNEDPEKEKEKLINSL